MNTRILKATIKNGTIIPEKGMDLYKNITHVKVIVIGKNDSHDKRKHYKGTLKKGWGDPVNYQRKMRKELGN